MDEPCKAPRSLNVLGDLAYTDKVYVRKPVVLLLLLLLTASGYVPGGSGTTVHKNTKHIHTLNT